MSEKPDKETLAIYNQGEMISIGVKGDFWNYVRDTFMAQISTLKDPTTIVVEGRSDEEIVKELRERISVADIIERLIKEIEATAEQHNSNKRLVDPSEDYLIQIND
jgi:hypothetical protein